MVGHNGTKANLAGTLAETVVGDILRACGISNTRHYRTKCHCPLGKQRTVDFYLPQVIGYRTGLYIEVRWQASDGSADEKNMALPEKMTCLDRPSLVVIDGPKSGPSREYLLDRVGGLFEQVFTIVEFIGWAASVADVDSFFTYARHFSAEQKTFRF